MDAAGPPTLPRRGVRSGDPGRLRRPAEEEEPTPRPSTGAGSEERRHREPRDGSGALGAPTANPARRSEASTPSPPPPTSRRRAAPGEGADAEAGGLRQRPRRLAASGVVAGPRDSSPPHGSGLSLGPRDGVFDGTQAWTWAAGDGEEGVGGLTRGRDENGGGLAEPGESIDRGGTRRVY